MSVDDTLRCTMRGDDSSIVKVSGIHRREKSELARLLSPPGVAVRAAGGHSDSRGTIFALVGAGLGALLGFGGGPPVSALLGIGGALLGVTLAAVIDVIREPREDARPGPEYFRKREQWERAYYCKKHDLAFIPGDERTGSPTEFRNLMG